jgi:hypothetical protein
MMIEITALYISRLNRNIMGKNAPIVCHAIGKKQFEDCVCDCKDICKKTPGTTNNSNKFNNNNFNNNKFNYVDNFDYELATLLLNEKRQC